MCPTSSDVRPGNDDYVRPVASHQGMMIMWDQGMMWDQSCETREWWSCETKEWYVRSVMWDQGMVMWYQRPGNGHVITENDHVRLGNDVDQSCDNKEWSCETRETSHVIPGNDHVRLGNDVDQSCDNREWSRETREWCKTNTRELIMWDQGMMMIIIVHQAGGPKLS